VKVNINWFKENKSGYKNMPRKTTSVNVEATTPVVSAPTPVVETVVAPVKKVVVKKKKVVTPVVDEITQNLEPVSTTPTPPESTTPVPTTPAPAVETTTSSEVPAPEEDEKAPKRQRRQVTKDSFYKDFETFFKQSEIDFADKKSYLKNLARLKTDAYKLLRIRNQSDERKKGENSNSGFNKPVNVSDDLAEFIGIGNDQLITRVLITKKICQHIKDQDLQNPEDRRMIIPDEPLKKLFSITEEDKEPLTYYGIQKRIQRHILKKPKEEEGGAVVSASA